MRAATRVATSRPVPRASRSSASRVAATRRFDARERDDVDSAQRFDARMALVALATVAATRCELLKPPACEAAFMEAVEGSASVVTPAAPSRLKPRARDVVLESKSEHAGEDLRREDL